MHASLQSVNIQSAGDREVSGTANYDIEHPIWHTLVTKLKVRLEREAILVGAKALVRRL